LSELGYAHTQKLKEDRLLFPEKKEKRIILDRPMSVWA
jgi:hypothetical protein